MLFPGCDVKNEFIKKEEYKRFEYMVWQRIELFSSGSISCFSLKKKFKKNVLIIYYKERVNLFKGVLYPLSILVLGYTFQRI